MITLFHHTLSVSSRFVRLALAECEIPFEATEERFWQRREAFLLMNPANTLPVLLTDEGTPVSGVWAVTEYLDEVYGPPLGDHRLLPVSRAARAEVRRLVDWFTQKFDEEVTRYVVEEKYVKREMAYNGADSAPNSNVLRAARSNIRTHLRYLEHMVHQRNWLAGDRMTFADLAAAAALSLADYLGEVPWSEAEEARHWYAKLKSRPAFRLLLGDQIRGHVPPVHYADLDF